MNQNGHVLIFFMDGVGLGPADPETNPFMAAHMPNISGLLGERWFVRPDGWQTGGGRRTTERALTSRRPADPWVPPACFFSEAAALRSFSR